MELPRVLQSRALGFTFLCCNHGDRIGSAGRSTLPTTCSQAQFLTLLGTSELWGQSNAIGCETCFCVPSIAPINWVTILQLDLLEQIPVPFQQRADRNYSQHHRKHDFTFVRVPKAAQTWTVSRSTVFWRSLDHHFLYEQIPGPVQQPIDWYNPERNRQHDAAAVCF